MTSTYYERLKDLRESNGLSGEDVAKVLGITGQAYRYYEKGLRQPNIENIIALAELFGVSTDYLLGRDAPPPTTISTLLAEDKALDPFERAFISLYIKSDERIRKELVDTIKKAVKETEQAEAVQDLTADNIIILPLYVNRVSAGTGFDLLDLDDTEQQAFVETKTAHKADFVLQIDGDSMLPKFCDGDYILVKKADSIDIDRIGVYRYQGKGYIKQQKPGYIHSLNARYADIYPTETDDISVIGEVLGTIEIAH